MTRADLPKPQLELTEIVNENGIVILRGRPDPATVTPVAGPLVVVFCSLASMVEFAGSTARSGRSAIFVSDRKRLWFAMPADVNTIVRAVRAEMAELGQEQIDTIGFSMGGFAALAYGNLLPVRNALAFSPRFSPDQEIVRDRRTYPNLTRNVQLLALRSVTPGLRRIGWASIVHGTIGPDRPHLRHFPRDKNFDHHMITRCGHFVAQWLRAREALEPLIQAVLTDDRHAAQRHMRAAGTIPRHLLNNRMARAEARLRRAFRAVRRRFRAVSTTFIAPIKGTIS